MHVCLLNSCFCVAACLSRVRGYYTSTCFLEFLSVCRICRFRVTNEAGAVGVNWLSICLAQGLCFRSETSVNCSFGQAFSLVNLKKGDSALVPCWRFPQFNSNVASLSTNKTLGERQAGLKNAKLNEDKRGADCLCADAKKAGQTVASQGYWFSCSIGESVAATYWWSPSSALSGVQRCHVCSGFIWYTAVRGVSCALVEERMCW